DGDAAHAIDVFGDLNLTRMADQMIQLVLASKRDVNEIVLGVVRNAEHREPFRHDLITEVERCYLYLGPLADQYIGHSLEVRLPCLLREKKSIHGREHPSYRLEFASKTARILL